uniref:Uncharacterized protein n=1 Tax=viral metagenome TaxID=1070528 RepID=A0A6C0K3D0_9ZZZZ
MSLVLSCPHCQEWMYIEKKDVNCAIFRHAVFRATMEPIPPHSSREECERLVSQNAVYGCAKPFRVVLSKTPVHNDDFVAEICDYI